MADKMFLYWGSGSIPCRKAMIVLEEKGFSGYGNKLIEFSKKEHKGEDIVKLNPRGQVPTFKDGDIVINESNAICQHLESRYKNKGPKLIPGDEKEEGAVLQRMYESANLQSNFLDIVYYQWRTKEEDRKEEVFEEKLKKGRDELAFWEKYLEESTTGFIANTKDFSMADVYVYPYVDMMDRMSMDMSKYPKIKAYHEKLKTRPSIVATVPPHWKDSDKPTQLSRV